MRWLHIARLRSRSLLRRGRVEDDLRDEIRFHLEERTRELVARGLSPREAHDAALRAFGGVDQRKEECRDTRRVRLVEDFAKDVGYALRLMRRSPGFTLVAVPSLAIGIGANTAMFSIVDLLLLRKLPIPRPERLVLLDTNTTISFSQFQALRERATMFDSVSAIWSIDRSNLIVHPASGDAGAAQPDAGLVRVGLASAEYFATMGLTASIGRTFAPDEDRVQGGHSIAVISDACLGLFGLVSYQVAQRTNEIGVRLALGATRGTVFAMVLGESGRLVIAGVACGLAASLATTRLIAARLYGISPTDLVTVAGATLLLLVIAMLASFLPARRASRVDPLTALRCE